MGLGDAVKEYEPIHDKIMPQIIVDEHIHPTIEDNGENSSMLHKLILLCSALDFISGRVIKLEGTTHISCSRILQI